MKCKPICLVVGPLAQLMPQLVTELEGGGWSPGATEANGR